MRETLAHRRIKPDPNNVRQHFRQGPLQALAESIRQYGLLENLVVKEADDGESFYIVAGERRWRAIALLIEEGLWDRDKEVPVLIIDTDGAWENVAENILREDVAPWELGYRFLAFQEAGYTQQEIGSRIGRNQGYVSRHAAIARGLHPASVRALEKLHASLTVSDLLSISALLDADKKPDEKAQRERIELLAGTRKHRQKRRASRTDTQRLMRRMKHLQSEARVPAHARQLVDAICDYLVGKTRTVNYPEEL